MEEIRVMMAYVKEPKPTDFKEIKVLINKEHVLSVIPIPGGLHRIQMLGVSYDSPNSYEDLQEKLA